MDTVRKGMDRITSVHMSTPSTAVGEIPRRDWSDLLFAFPGLGDGARRIEDALPQGWGQELDVDALLTSASKAALTKNSGRLVGMRTAWEGDDPATLAFAAELFAVISVVPEPDEAVVEHLAGLEGFEREGKIVALNSVPIPAGKEQVRFFVNLRWRWLFSPHAQLHLIALRDPTKVGKEDHAELSVEPGHKPHLRHLLGYDATHTSDETQQMLLTYNTAAHRENLTALQDHDFLLFLAVWRRDFPEIQKLSRHKPLEFLTPADSRGKHMRNARIRLIYGTAIMSELERTFEIAEHFRMDGGVSREEIERILKASASMSDIQDGATEAHSFVYGMVAHTRFLHPTMNEFVGSIRKDPVINQANAAFRQTKSYWETPQRLHKPSGEMPAKYFLGIEPQFLTAAAIMMMVRNLKHLEGNYAHRHTHGSGAKNEINDRLIVRLGALIMANICVPTARAMVGRIDRTINDDKWLRTKMPHLIDNPILAAEYEKAQARFEMSPAGLSGPDIVWVNFPEEDKPLIYASQIESVRRRVTSCPVVGMPGWTRGFHFQAWFSPTAELPFLRKVCRLTQYCPRAARRREKWTIGGKAKKLQNYTGSPKTTFTGLPRKHLVENVQDKFRPFFNNLQYADLLQPRWTVTERAVIDAFITEVARMMPAVTACTVDPYLNEAIIHKVHPLQQGFAADAAWN